MMAYLVRSMQTGGDLAKMLWRRMIDNAEEYMEEGVRAGTVITYFAADAAVWLRESR